MWFSNTDHLTKIIVGALVAGLGAVLVSGGAGFGALFLAIGGIVLQIGIIGSGVEAGNERSRMTMLRLLEPESQEADESA